MTTGFNVTRRNNLSSHVHNRFCGRVFFSVKWLLRVLSKSRSSQVHDRFCGRVPKEDFSLRNGCYECCPYHSLNASQLCEKNLIHPFFNPAMLLDSVNMVGHIKYAMICMHIFDGSLRSMLFNFLSLYKDLILHKLHAV
ncbi:hypothetical protein O6H91_10G007300 [Diphasiastrum complanatum]|uniref:Uncharacterized protein n=1 Tax=Diphasiastrum complanatum TaxID=34168 RepID=A0ACC2CE36_DIPCM|nr:hypothetical protein O6H91_10G007300 [Diphasiastrum complanatum]